MVHALVTVRGAEILTVVNFIPGFSEQSELFHYINKLLRVSVRFIIVSYWQNCWEKGMSCISVLVI